MSGIRPTCLQLNPADTQNDFYSHRNHMVHLNFITIQAPKFTTVSFDQFRSIDLYSLTGVQQCHWRCTEMSLKVYSPDGGMSSGSVTNHCPDMDHSSHDTALQRALCTALHCTALHTALQCAVHSALMLH